MPRKGGRATKAQLAALAKGRAKLSRLKGAGRAKRGKNKKHKTNPNAKITGTLTS